MNALILYQLFFFLINACGDPFLQTFMFLIKTVIEFH